MAHEFVFEVHPAAFWGVVWLAAYLAGYSRRVRNRRSVDYRECLRSSLFSGFLGFSTVAVLRALWPDYSTDGWHYVGVSALVGLLGNEQERILAHLANKVMDFMGVPKDASPEDRSDDSGLGDVDNHSRDVHSGNRHQGAGRDPSTGKH